MSDQMRALLMRIRGWDVMDVASDGKYWRSEIDMVLATPDQEETEVAMKTFPARQRLLNALGAMPEEAFGWLVIALQPPGLPPHPSPWPDGELGGFMDASRAAITETHAAAKAYLEGDGQ